MVAAYCVPQIERKAASVWARLFLLKGYIEVAEMEFRLRNAPARFKTKLFRDTLRVEF